MASEKTLADLLSSSVFELIRPGNQDSNANDSEALLRSESGLVIDASNLP